MATNRMILRHMDTGEEVVIATFMHGQGWETNAAGLIRLDNVFHDHHVRHRDYAEHDGPMQHPERCWKLVYEHGDEP